MKRLSFRGAIFLLVLLLLAFNVPFASAAQQTGDWSGDVPPSAQAAAAGREVRAPQPDEDGYTGPIPTAEGLPAGPASGELVDAAAGRNLSDASGPSADEALAAPDGWSTFYYIYAAGSTLKPRSSSERWDASLSGGCTYVTSASGEVLNLHLDLPTGARVEYLRMYYYDTSTSTSVAWVTTYNGEGDYSDAAVVSSSGNSGYGTTLSAAVSHIVANDTSAYVLNWRPNATGTTMQLCGLRVAYRLPTP